MSSPKFPYYSGNIFQSNCIGFVSLESFIEAHRNPTINTIKLLDKIQQATDNKDAELKLKLKKQLYTFTPAVAIPIGKARKYENISHFTGLMQLDFDKIETVHDTVRLRDHLFKTHKQIVCIYLSPSGLGIKALLKIKICKDIEQYRAVHKAVTTTFEEYGYFDEATKNAILPLFLSADFGIKYRDYDKCPAWSKEDWSKVEYVRLNDSPPPEFDINNRDALKVARIITNRINNISGDGHPQVRATALVLGSRVGAGYISQTEAENLIESLIRSNSYLQKGIDGYLRTAFWGISEGIKNPKYF